jgi:hypothetical protein
LDEVEVDGFEIEFARLDFGQIEDAVDEVEEGVAAGANGFEVAALLFRGGGRGRGRSCRGCR